jgi:hypothetical protein
MKNFILTIFFIFGVFAAYKAYANSQDFGYVSNIQKIETNPNEFTFYAKLVYNQNVVKNQYEMTIQDLGAHQIDQDVKIYYNTKFAILWGFFAFLFCFAPLMFLTDGHILEMF